MSSVVHYQFPYVKFHGKSYPLIPIRLKRGSASVKTFALLDSGASMSVFRPEIAKALKIHPSKQSAVRLGTANGGLDIRVAQVEVQVGRTHFKSNMGFSSREAVHFNIIGREGFFRHFSICFNEIMKTVVLVPLKSIRKEVMA